MSRALVIAVSRALAQADARAERATPPERSGLFVGQETASPSAVAAFEDALAERGYGHVPGALFTKRVLNTATGATSRARDLRGPTLTISTGRGSGLVALALAAEHLATRDDADRLVVGAVDEGEGDGAAAVVLSATQTAGAVEVADFFVEPPSLPSPSGAGGGEKVAVSGKVVVVPGDVVARASAGLLAIGRAIRGVGDRWVEEHGDLASVRVRLR